MDHIQKATGRQIKRRTRKEKYVTHRKQAQTQVRNKGTSRMTLKYPKINNCTAETSSDRAERRHRRGTSQKKQHPKILMCLNIFQRVFNPAGEFGG